MNERLVEDWLTKANERSYQTPFAQSLLAEGMSILRVGHGPHEHGKDIIAIDGVGRIHAYQLKDGSLDLKQFEKEFGQITALVETQVEHPAIVGTPNHQPWLVISGEVSMPVEDRIRSHNIQWKKRGYKSLRLVTGTQLLRTFTQMASNFWPQMPQDSRSLFDLYLTDGKGCLDRNAFAQLILSTTTGGKNKAEAARRLSAASLFASYALSPFYRAENHWELIQGWTIAAAQIAWAANGAQIPFKIWHPTFRLAVNEGLVSLRALAAEALQQPGALGPMGFELDELTRSRCTVCAGVIAANVLLGMQEGRTYDHKDLAKHTLEELFLKGRLVVWGESAVPFFLAIMWALDSLRGDQFSDGILLSLLRYLVHTNSRFEGPKLPPPYDSADEANAKALRRLFQNEKAMEKQAAASYTLEPLVIIATRRLWKNLLASFWAPITKTDLVRLVPDKAEDLLLWHWGHERGANQVRLFPAPQSWRDLLDQARADEPLALPKVIRTEFDFALLFLLCFPHRLTTGMAKYMEQKTHLSYFGQKP